MRVNLNKIKQQKIWLMDEIQSKKKSTKVPRNKIKILKNKDRKKNIWEIVIGGLNWKEKNFYKWKNNKIKN
jgi:hypothetical protein